MMGRYGLINDSRVKSPDYYDRGFASTSRYLSLRPSMLRFRMSLGCEGGNELEVMRLKARGRCAPPPNPVLSSYLATG